MSYAAEKTVLVWYVSLKGENFSLLVSGLQSFDSLSNHFSCLELKQVRLCPPTGKQLLMGRRRMCGSLLTMVRDPRLWRQHVLVLELHLWRGLSVGEGHVSCPSFLCFHYGWAKNEARDDENERNLFLQRNPKFHSSKGQRISALTWNHRSEAHVSHPSWQDVKQKLEGTIVLNMMQDFLFFVISYFHFFWEKKGQKPISSTTWIFVQPLSWNLRDRFKTTLLGTIPISHLV